MKRFKWAILATSLSLLFTSAPIGAYAESSMKLEFMQKPYTLKYSLPVVQDRTLIHIQDLADMVQGLVTVTDTHVTLTAEKETIRFERSQNKAFAGEKWIEIEPGIKEMNQQLYLPLRWTLPDSGGSLEMD